MNNQKFYFAVSGYNISITVNGKTYTLFEEDENRFESVLGLVKAADASQEETDIAKVLTIFDPDYVVERLDGMNRLRNGSYVLEGINVPMPNDLAAMYREYVEKGLNTQSLNNFWKMLVLNPDKHVRESLFRFAKRYNFPITKEGHFVAYKSVAWAAERFKRFASLVNRTINDMKVSGHGNSPLDEEIFIGMPEGKYEEAHILTKSDVAEKLKSEYPDFKRTGDVFADFSNAYKKGTTTEIWKEADQTLLDIGSINKGLKNGTLRMTAGGMEILEKTEGESIVFMTLEEAFEKVQELMQVEGLEFTDHYSKTTSIRIGEAVSMPREDCDNDPQNTCSAGLHVGAPSYVKDFGHSERFVLACLINPINVVAVPSDYSDTKMRVCEYFPFALAKMVNGTIEELDKEVAVENYTPRDIENLEARLAEINAEEGISDEEKENAEAILQTVRTRIQ